MVGKKRQVVIVGDSRIQYLESTHFKDTVDNIVIKCVPDLTFQELEETVSGVAGKDVFPEGVLLICSLGLHEIIDFSNIIPCIGDQTLPNLYLKLQKKISLPTLSGLKLYREKLLSVLGESSDVLFTTILPINVEMYMLHRKDDHLQDTSCSSDSPKPKYIKFLKQQIRQSITQHNVEVKKFIVQKEYNHTFWNPSLLNFPQNSETETKYLTKNHYLKDGINPSKEATEKYMVPILRQNVEKMLYYCTLTKSCVSLMELSCTRRQEEEAAAGVSQDHQHNQDKYQHIVIIGDSRVEEMRHVWPLDVKRNFYVISQPKVSFSSLTEESPIIKIITGLENSLIVLSVGVYDFINFEHEKTCSNKCLSTVNDEDADKSGAGEHAGVGDFKLPVLCPELSFAEGGVWTDFLNYMKKADALVRRKTKNCDVIITSMYPFDFVTFQNHRIRSHAAETGHTIESHSPFSSVYTVSKLIEKFVRKLNKFARRLSQEKTLPFWDFDRVVSSEPLPRVNLGSGPLYDGINPSVKVSHRLTRYVVQRAADSVSPVMTCDTSKQHDSDKEVNGQDHTLCSLLESKSFDDLSSSDDESIDTAQECDMGLSFSTPTRSQDDSENLLQEISSCKSPQWENESISSASLPDDNESMIESISSTSFPGDQENKVEIGYLSPLSVDAVSILSENLDSISSGSFSPDHRIEEELDYEEQSDDNMPVGNDDSGSHDNISDKENDDTQPCVDKEESVKEENTKTDTDNSSSSVSHVKDDTNNKNNNQRLSLDTGETTEVNGNQDNKTEELSLVLEEISDHDMDNSDESFEKSKNDTRNSSLNMETDSKKDNIKTDKSKSDLNRGKHPKENESKTSNKRVSSSSSSSQEKSSEHRKYDSKRETSSGKSYSKNDSNKTSTNRRSSEKDHHKKDHKKQSFRESAGGREKNYKDKNYRNSSPEDHYSDVRRSASRRKTGSERSGSPVRYGQRKSLTSRKYFDSRSRTPEKSACHGSRRESLISRQNLKPAENFRARSRSPSCNDAGDLDVRNPAWCCSPTQEEFGSTSNLRDKRERAWKQEKKRKYEESDLVRSGVCDSEYNKLHNTGVVGHRSGEAYRGTVEAGRMEQHKVDKNKTGVVDETDKQEDNLNITSDKCVRVELVEILELLSQLGEKLGTYSGPIKLLYEEALQLKSSGEDPVKLLDDFDNKILIHMVSDKLKSAAEETNLSIIHKIIMQEAKERLNLLFEDEIEQSVLSDLDIDDIASACMGKDSSETSVLIETALLYHGHTDLTPGQINRVHAAVRDKQQELLNLEKRNNSKRGDSPDNSSLLFSRRSHRADLSKKSSSKSSMATYRSSSPPPQNTHHHSSKSVHILDTDLSYLSEVHSSSDDSLDASPVAQYSRRRASPPSLPRPTTTTYDQVRDKPGLTEELKRLKSTSSTAADVRSSNLLPADSVQSVDQSTAVYYPRVPPSQPPGSYSLPQQNPGPVSQPMNPTEVGPMTSHNFDPYGQQFPPNFGPCGPVPPHNFGWMDGCPTPTPFGPAPFGPLPAPGPFGHPGPVGPPPPPHNFDPFGPHPAQYPGPFGVPPVPGTEAYGPPPPGNYNNFGSWPHTDVDQSAGKTSMSAQSQANQKSWQPVKKKGGRILKKLT